MTKSEGLKAFLLIFSMIALFEISGKALTIHVTYDTSVTSDAGAAQIESGFSNAVKTIQTLYTNPITVNITVYWGPHGPFTGGIGLGASESQIIGTVTYAQLTNALRNLRNTSIASNAVASLPSSDPIAGNVWWIPRAEQKALIASSTPGYPTLGVSANDSTTDGEIGFATNVNYTFDPTNRAISGKYDFIAVATHEITEVMGRITFDLSTTYLPYDLFRYTNSGARNFDYNGTGVYLSIDRGTNNLKSFNPNNGGDITDWASSGTPDSCDAFLSSGHEAGLSYADLVAMNIIGYKLNYPTPKLSVTNQSSNFVMTFTNITGTTYSVLATTNLTLSVTNWPTIGTATDSVPGNFQFINARTNSWRFYRLKLN